MNVVRPRALVLIVGAVIAAGALAAALAEARVSPGPYKGRTSQQQTIRFTVSGGRVTRLRTLVRLLCFTTPGSRTSFQLVYLAPRASWRIGRGGRFSGRGRHGGIQYRVSGRLSGRAGSGTIHASTFSSSYDPSENEVYTTSCSASPRFTARR